MKLNFRGLIVVTSLLICCLSTFTNTALATPVDDDFAMKAAAAGMKEVELGRLAARQGQSSTVKNFGRKMVADHTSAGNKLKALTMKKGMTLPTEMDADAKAALARLSGLKGAEFDKAYMEMMVSDHEMAVADFEAESKSGADVDLKAFAMKTLPTLRGHLEMARTGSSRLSSTASKTN